MDKPDPSWEQAKEDAKKKHDANDAYWKNVFPAIFTPENEQRYFKALKLAKDFNCSVDQILNAYALAHPRLNFLTIGPVTLEELKKTLGSLAIAKKLSTEQLDYLYYKNDAEKNKTKALYLNEKKGQNLCQKVFEFK